MFLWVSIVIFVVLVLWIWLAHRADNPSLKSLKGCSPTKSLTYFENKKDKFKNRRNELDEYIKIIETQAIKEIVLAAELTDNLKCNGVNGEKDINCNVIRDRGGYDNKERYYVDYGSGSYDIFKVEFTTDCPHVKRFNRLRKLILKYKEEDTSIYKLESKIDKSIKLLENEISYRDTLKKIKDFNDSDSGLGDFDINDVFVEIKALEKQIDFQLEIDG